MRGNCVEISVAVVEASASIYPSSTWISLSVEVREWAVSDSDPIE